MKRGVKRWLVILLIAIIALGLIYFLRFTGFAVRDYPKQVQFYFYDEVSGCDLEGYVFAGEKLIGKSEGGYFNLSFESYKENIMDRNLNISMFGKLGDCFNSELLFDKYWRAPEIEEEKFLGDSLFKFPTKINFNNPAKRDLIGFVRAEDIKSELEKIDLRGNMFDDLSEINKYLNEKVKYIEDWEFGGENNSWRIPEDTLRDGFGDCEDYSTTLLSLFLAYNNSLNCYNVVLTSHVTTFCKIDDYYIYYDQGRTELKERIDNGKKELEKLKNNYFKYYGINESESKVHYAFNDREFFEFNNDEEFIDWQMGLDGRESEDMFERLEAEYLSVPVLFSPVEENTRTVVLSESKDFSYLILSLGGLLVVLTAIWFLFKFLRG